MRKQLPAPRCSLSGVALLCGLAACSSKTSTPDAKDSGQPDSGSSSTDGGCKAGSSSGTYVLIDDMETTDHGPIVLPGIDSPLSPGYWYNSGAGYSDDAGAPSDMSTPPQGSFVFSSLPSPTTTLNCKTSAHAAHQSCSLNGLYDTCGVGFEFAQQDAPDAGAASASDAAGDAGASIPRVTVPFDISRYKTLTFWGMTTTPDSTGSLQVKVQLPDTDTDPRGDICNNGGGNTSKCYNSYGKMLSFTTSWQKFTVALDAGRDGGTPPDDGIAIDHSWGYQDAQWIPTQVYGINWQAQRNSPPDAGAPLMTDIWIDDVYFE